MPIKKTGLVLPAGLEKVKDLKWFYAVSTNLIGKDFKSIDTTAVVSFVPQNNIANIVNNNQWRRNYIEVQGASAINHSSLARSADVTLTYDPLAIFPSTDYYYQRNFSSEKPYYESTLGSTAGSVFIFDTYMGFSRVEESGKITKLLPDITAQVGIVFRIFHETAEDFYVLMCDPLAAPVRSTSVVADATRSYIFKITKATWTTSVITPAGTNNAKYSNMYQILDTSTYSVFVGVPSGYVNAATGFCFYLFNKTTFVITSTTNSTAPFPTLASSTGNTNQSISITKAVSNSTYLRSYFPYENRAGRALSIRMQKFPLTATAIGDLNFTTDTITCTINGLPTDLLNNWWPAAADTTTGQPLYNIALHQFTDNSIEYLVINYHPVSDPVTNYGTQRHVVLSVNSSDPTILTYVTHYDPLTSYPMVLPSADGKSLLLANDYTFLLLNWNRGAQQLIPSKEIRTTSIIKRVAYDNLNQIWINTNADYVGSSGQDTLEIFYPTGTKYVKLTPVGSTTLEYAGTALQPTFKVSVFDLTGTRLSQNVTLEAINAKFLGGASSITILTSGTDDITVTLNITSSGPVQVIATNF